MLDAEEAAARLDALADPGWAAEAEQRLSTLPEAYRAHAAVLLERPGRWDSRARQAHSERLRSVAEALDAMPAGQRADLLRALHPGLGTTLARWWARAVELPYQRGWSRWSLRAPSVPEASRPARAADLAVLLEALAPHPQADPAWVAGWGAHLAGRNEMNEQALGALLACAVDDEPGGEQVLQTLVQVATGDHPVGVFGRYVVVALLGTARPQGWDQVRRLLLAAQRQEGLRQAILESADEGRPDAFDLILSTVLDEDLLRFPAAVRAAGVWLGFDADVGQMPLVRERLRILLELRADEDARLRALACDDPWHVMIALIVRGMVDVLPAVQEAEGLLERPSQHVRAVAVRFAARTQLIRGQRLLAAAVDDPDPAVAALAARRLVVRDQRIPESFDALGRLVTRLPERARTVEGLGVELEPVTLSRQSVADRLVHALHNRPVEALLPFMPAMGPEGRGDVARLLAGRPPDPEIRAALLSLLADRSPTVRAHALTGLERQPLTAQEAPGVEALLTRSATAVRRGALSLLSSLPVEEVRASVERLAASRHRGQREAAEELARSRGVMLEQSSEAPEADASMADPEPAIAHQGPVDVRQVLVAPARRSPATPPRAVRGEGGFGDEVAWRIVHALDDFVAGLKDTTVTFTSWQGSHEVLLGDLEYLPGTHRHGARSLTEQDEPGHGLVLPEVFGEWWAQRPAQLRGQDGVDALQSYALVWQATQGFRDRRVEWWLEILRLLVGQVPTTLRFPVVVRHVLDWLALNEAGPATVRECLDAVETSLALVPDARLEQDLVPEQSSGGGSLHILLAHGDWRGQARDNPWEARLHTLLARRPDLFGAEPLARWLGLVRWFEQPRDRARTLPVDVRLLAASHAAGVATDDDALATLLHPGSELLSTLTRPRRTRVEARHSALVRLADRVRDEVVDVEAQRGDLPTPTSAVALNLASVRGAEAALGLLARLGRAPLQRGWSWGESREDKDSVLSHLLRVSFPGPQDTGESVRRAAAAAGIAEQRLVDLALFAPQWAPLLEEALEWPGLATGALWLHAHTKDDNWLVDAELRQEWAASITERTPLSTADLLDGAVDVAWFRQCHALLGEHRWQVLHRAAKNCAAGNGHKRAQLFAEAMLGQVDEATLVERIRIKRHQDSVRALGLLPLPPVLDGDEDGDGRRAVVHRRYAVLREFERGSRQFGSQRQDSERLAVRIGVENLARTAGYQDPVRFTWAVEAAEAGDLADGPVALVHGDVTLTLSVSDEGVPDLAITRAGRPLNAVPAALRKQPDVVELRARNTALTRQASRVRASLEAAMVAQDTFTAEDLTALRRHPLVAPMLDRLLWVEGDGHCFRRGDTSGDHPDGPVRLAHPVDLLGSDWVHWQERTFASGRRQPFKQVFRELYVLTDAERADSPASRRYEGHQLQPRQAMALFGARGWRASHETGTVSRTFHRHGLTAHVELAEGFLTPAEADLPTLGPVHFTRRGEHLVQPLHDVPPVVFSETMRDLDLVVSVAHAGGVDPEATASTIQMREALVRETARLLKLTNISFVGSHVLVEGSLGEYSLHLGSGTVHRRPGGAVCIVPVGSQHRGRLFLPFADDDPKTAEIVAKVLLLARDREIKDPTILAQLRA